MQKKLDFLGKILVVISVVLCILVVVIGIAYKRDAKEMVFVGLSLAVSVIPEGLVAVVTSTTVYLFVIYLLSSYACGCCSSYGCTECNR